MPVKVTMPDADQPEEEPAEVPAPEEPGIDVEEDDDTLPLSLEDADPNDTLWPDGPTVADVLAFKEAHGDVFVTSPTVERHLMWRTLTRRDYRAIVRHMEELSATGEYSPSEINMIQEELITETCLLVPKMKVEDFDGDLAGLPSLLSQQILESSGFTAFDTRGF